MDNITIKIGERMIPLHFGMDEYGCLEEEVGQLSDFEEMVFTGKKRIHNIMKMIRIMGNKGLKMVGEKADLTDEWLSENMKPRSMKEYQSAVTAVISMAMSMETDTAKDPNVERDIVLEEIEKKENAIDSHTGK